MYYRSSAASCVNEARLDLFARKQRTYDAIPPTRAALREHAKRAAYQGGVILGQATASNPETSTPADWDWVQSEEAWKIHCTSDNPSINSCMLPGINQMLLQERLPQEVQLFPRRTFSYRSVQLCL